jgi:hypothetical protein
LSESSATGLPLCSVLCEPDAVNRRFTVEPRRDLDRIPDVRDGLTRVERVILYVLSETQKERDGRNVPTAMLYGRVVEHVNISEAEFQRTLQRLVGR